MMLPRTHLLFVLAALLLLGGMMGWAHQPVVLAEPANYDCAAQDAIPTTECEALVAIYNANPDANLSGWLVDGSLPCNWTGVTCTDDVVTGLTLSFRNLTAMPAEIGQLSNLQSLSLGANLFTAMPPEIGQLSNLQYLSLSDNKLEALPSQIGQLSNLQSLWLVGNQLTALPSEIGQLSNLQYLFLDNNELTILSPQIGQLSNLQELWLYDNQLTALPLQIGQLSNLQTLSLFNNQLTAVPAQIGQLNNLTSLNLSNNQLTAVPAEIGQLRNLQGLSLYNNRLTTVPTEIGQLSNLTELDLSWNQLTAVPAEIGQLSNLTMLWLDNNKLCGDLPISVTNLANLQTLNISHNHLTATDPALLNWLNTYQPSWEDTQTPCIVLTLGENGSTITTTVGSDAIYDVQITNNSDLTLMFAITITDALWETIVTIFEATQMRQMETGALSITLGAGQTANLRVTVVVPPTAVAGNTDTATIVATVQDDPSISYRLMLTTTAVVPPVQTGHKIYLPLITR